MLIRCLCVDSRSLPNGESMQISTSQRLNFIRWRPRYVYCSHFTFTHLSTKPHCPDLSRICIHKKKKRISSDFIKWVCLVALVKSKEKSICMDWTGHIGTDPDCTERIGRGLDISAENWTYYVNSVYLDWTGHIGTELDVLCKLGIPGLDWTYRDRTGHIMWIVLGTSAEKWLVYGRNWTVWTKTGHIWTKLD